MQSLQEGGRGRSVRKAAAGGHGRRDRQSMKPGAETREAPLRPKVLKRRLMITSVLIMSSRPGREW